MRGNPPPVPRLALALVLSAVAFLCICPGPRDPASPLPADMASHTLGAVAFADGVRHFDLPQLGRALLGADLYPPGHSVVQGSWILCFGDSPMSLWIFRWVLLFLSTIVVLQLASRSGVTGVAARIAAGAIWLASPFLLGLSATFLVEPAAILLLLASLLSIDTLARNPKRRTLILACLLLSGTVLTKYNFGLPLIPALGLLAVGEFFRGRRRESVALLLLAGFAVGSWALFLSLQVDGWESFLRFARNRSTTEGWSMLDRLLAYLRIHAMRGVAHPSVAGWMLVLVGGHLLAPRSRSRLLPLGALYILITLLSLSRHPYLLSRNLSAAIAVFAVLAATGAGRMITFGLPVLARLMGMGARFRSTGSWLTGALAFALLVLALPAARREYRVHERVELTELQSLSETLQAEMRRSDELLVLGCFNEFSNAWVQLLRRRTPGAGRVWVGLPPPVERTRQGIPTAYVSGYVERLREWQAAHPSATILTITLSEDSTWWTEDYQRWNQWKGNWTVAIASMGPATPHPHRYELAGGLMFVDACEPSLDELEFRRGWGPTEAWGRWALESTSGLWVAELDRARRLILEAAPFEAMVDGEQICRIRGEDLDTVEWRIEGRPWEWRELVLQLPAGFSGKIILEFEYRWPTDENGAMRALPFRRIQLDSGGGVIL